MEFRFDANQEFQVRAIEAVADLFDGQAPVSAQVQFKEGTISLAAIANRLDLDEARVLANLQAVQKRNRIRPDAKLKSAAVKGLGLKKDGLFICRDVALTDEQAANLALQCKLKTI